MRAARMAGITALSAIGMGAAVLVACTAPVRSTAAPAAAACPGDNGGIPLPPGFCATVWADNLGNIRHIAFAPDGVAYVNSWSGTYYGGAKGPPDGFLIALQDANGDGQAEVVKRFGETTAD